MGRPNPSNGEPVTDDIMARFRTCADEVLSVDSSTLVSETRFADLNADSLELVELAMALEEEFDITIEDEEFDEMHTVQAAIDLIATKTA